MMMKSTLTKIAFLFLLAGSFTACDKYEEGANVSLLTAKMRMVNHWKLSKVTITNGNSTYDATSNYPSTILKMKKDDTFEFIYTSGNLTSNETGTWSLNDDKTTVTLVDSDGDTVTYTIIKLKNKDLKVEETSGSYTYVYTFTEDK